MWWMQVVILIGRKLNSYSQNFRQFLLSHKVLHKNVSISKMVDNLLPNQSVWQDGYMKPYGMNFMIPDD